MSIQHSNLKPLIFREEETERRKKFTIKSSLKSFEKIVSIIIPVYNEEKTIKQTLNRIPNHLKYEIIIVDDGSTDKSVEQIKKSNQKGIKIIHHKKNEGYGAAIQTGLEHASGEIIVTIDSDGQHNPKEIPRLLVPLITQKADMVIGSRYLGSCDYKVPFHTRLGERVINLFINLLYDQNVSNNQSGFRAFRKEHKNYLKGLKYTGMACTTELLLRATSNGLKLMEVPINLKNREHGISKVKLLKITLAISRCLLRYLIKRIFKNLHF